MWQFNGDAAVEFLSAAYFPEYFHVDKTRINRPGYPVLAKALGEGYGLLVLPIYKLNPLEKGMLGYITLKLAIYITTAICLFNLIRTKFSAQVALISVTLLLLHPFAIRYIGTFHTSELQFVTPIILVTLLLNLAKNYSHRKNIIYSLIAGFMMLAKQNYSVYLAILLFSFFVIKRYKESILSFVSHLIPLLLWLVCLKFFNLPYYNHEVASNNDGIWLITGLFNGHIFATIQSLINFSKDWLIMITSYFTGFIFLAVAAIHVPEIKAKLSNKEWLFLLIFIGANWLQFLAANSPAPHLTSDLAFFVYPLAAYLIYRFTNQHNLNRFIPAFFAIYLVIGLMSMVRLPWVHPYQQNGVTNPDRVKILEEGKLIPRNSN